MPTRKPDSSSAIPPLLLLGLLLVIQACGGGGDNPADGPIQAPPARPLAVSSTSGCSVDRDCAKGNYCFLGQCASACQSDPDCPGGQSCTQRGRCIPPEQGSSTSPTDDRAVAEAGRLEGLKVIDADASRFLIGENQTSITYELTLNRPTPDGGIPYRIDRSDDDEITTRVEYIDSDGETLSFEIPVGRADPSSQDSRRVQLKLFTPLGNHTLTLVPEYSVSGRYSGTATFGTFGQSGLGVDLEIVTNPDGAPLNRAEEVWLVLPVGRQHLLSPLSPSPTAPDSVARPLTYEEASRSWVATFEGAYDLTGNDIVRVPDSDQVRRSLRFQLNRRDEGTLTGGLSDHWTGLYEPKSASGSASRAPFSFTARLALSRIGSARSHSDVTVKPLPEADPQTPPPPKLDRCSEASFFDVEQIETDDGTFDCDNVADAEAFTSSSRATQASCAMAVSARSLTGKTTIRRVEAYLNGQNDDSRSFTEFMQDCAAHVDGLCQPAPKVRCGRQLVARAYDRQPADSSMLAPLVTQYSEATRETFYGQQVAAFYSDTALREEWLRSASWPPTFQGLKDLVGSMLEDWKQQVLETHIGSLRGQFDSSGLSVLSRDAGNEAASTARSQLLIGMTQSWRGSIDALTLATKRWNILYQSEQLRRQKAGYVAGHILDFYLAAGMLRKLNTIAGTEYLTARLAGGFDVLVDELDRLSRPFSDLIYARDGEVVVSRSLDPTADNEKLLSKRAAEARTQVQKAKTDVQDILDESQQQALDEQQIKSRWADRIDEARTDLVEMCGRPVGCEAVNYLEGAPPEECQIRWQAGRCGFKIDRATDKVVAARAGQQNTSEAGQILLDVAEAIQNIQIADAERNALAQRISLRYAELDAFSRDIKRRDNARLQWVQDLEANLKERTQIRNEAVSKTLRSMEKSAKLHQTVIDESRSRFDRWEQMESAQSEAVLGKLVKAENQRVAARVLNNQADTAVQTADLLAEALPKSISDFFSSGRVALKTSGFLASQALNASAMGLEQSAGQVDLARERLQMRQETKMTDLKRQLKVDKAKWSAEIAELRRQRSKRRQLTRQQIRALEETIKLARHYLEAQLAHKRDLAEFRAKRTKVKEMLTKVSGLDLRYSRAKLQLTQVLERYRRVVQRARNTHAQLEKLTDQRTRVNALLGSPDVMFAKANRLKSAERSLLAARRELMDWLVALEYYAVRPFLDERMQILLARNPYQLEQIAGDLQNLQETCGGNRSEIDTVLSVREDLLGITQPSRDAVTDQTFSPAERFRELLNRGYVPVDKRIRYSSDETVGQMMTRGPDIMAGTFFIDLEDFANLPVSCNAKVKSVAVNLVGQGLPQVRPTVTLLYDGTSKLRSCQPGLSDYIDRIGAEGATTYDTISRFNPQGQSMAPVSTVNGFGPDGGQPNTTLNGLPLASQYTLLINKKVAENADIDWSKLEDIELKLIYTYQDNFQTGQCSP